MSMPEWRMLSKKHERTEKAYAVWDADPDRKQNAGREHFPVQKAGTSVY